MRLHPRDLILRLDLSERCNLRCTMCHFRDGAGTYDMPLSVFERIASEIFPMAHTVHLSCGTEPMMSRLFVPALQRARQAGLPAIRLISNATLLNDKNAHALAESKADLVVISLDGATKETYERIRVGARWDKVLENIRRLQELKRAFNTSFPRVMLAFVLQRSNIEEIPAFMDLAHELGAEEVQFQELVLVFADMEKDALNTKALQVETDRLMDIAREKADEYGISLFTVPAYYHSGFRRTASGWLTKLRRTLHVLRRGVQKRSLPAIWMEIQYRLAPLKSRLVRGSYVQRCFEPWRTVVLHADGGVVPCSLWHGAPLGNLQDNSFVSIWGNEEYGRLRKELANGNLRPGCQACPAYSGNRRYAVD